MNKHLLKLCSVLIKVLHTYLECNFRWNFNIAVNLILGTLDRISITNKYNLTFDSFKISNPRLKIKIVIDYLWWQNFIRSLYSRPILDLIFDSNLGKM